ncbi:MAG: hypothetical protein ACRD3W_26570 [Terriglobales bacterium]
MFQETYLSYSFGIADYTPAAPMPEPDELKLREVWLSHLRHEQEKVDEEDAKRHPLIHELEARHFFVH